jgi:pimeloyl-ACP methyl ester carboxylesterase
VVQLLSDSQTSRRRAVIALAVVAVLVASGPSTLATAPQSDEGIKNIRGLVVDVRGEPVVGANVFIRDVGSNITRTFSTDDEGVYTVNGLPAGADYEVHVLYLGTESETKLVTSFLNRRDNAVNFELPIAVIPTVGSTDGEGVISLETFDRVVLRASFELPEGIPAPIPAALLLHGYGEDRSVWADLEARLLSEGWAVMSLDLRGHGRSTTRNSEPLAPAESWRSDPQQFPQDLNPALDWLKTQERIDSNRLAVIGVDVGANLALVASGRFSEVGTSIAINPNIEEAIALAGAGQEFNPSTVMIIESDLIQGVTARQYVAGASRLTIVEGDGGTVVWLATGDTLDQIVRWLRDTY